MLLFEEVKEKLKQYDPSLLLEILDISSDELVERFEDKIEEREDYFSKDLEDEEDF